LNQLLQKENFDAIHVQHIRMAQYFEGHSNLENVILDLPDAFSLYWKRRIEKSHNFFHKWFTKFEFQRLFKYELQMIPKFKKVLVCSREDQQYLIENTGIQVELLQNGVNTEVFAPRQHPFIRNRVLFTGNMDYAPNIDAVSYFVEEIWPKVLVKVPNARFVIAGQRPVAKVLSLKSENIDVTGFIPNLADEYAKAHVVVSPLRIGAGTQNKVLEALSMNIPVVSTNVGYSGLELEKNEGIALSLNSDEFAENVIKLLCDDDFRNNLGINGGEKIRTRFSWQGIALQLQSYFQQITGSN
jgi:glycosyltransferase involved in cell wall biosynthesis